MKMFRLKDMSIGFRLWLLFMGFVIPCIFLLSLMFKNILVDTRDQEIYLKIQQAQEMLANRDDTSIGAQRYNVSFSVYHIGIVGRKVKYMSFPDTRYKGLLTPLLEKMGSSFNAQEKNFATYKSILNGYALYYIVRKSGEDGVISFMIDVPFDSVYQKEFYVVVAFTIGAIVLATLFSLLFLKTVTRPLKQLQKSITKMAEGDFQMPVEVDRADEIGMLSREMEKTRIQLARRDFLRQSAVQYVSHELKTPVMTINSYAQSILDGVYPKGGVTGSARVISGQAQRLQQLIMKLLTVTKLDYMESKPAVLETFDLAELAEDVCSRTGMQRPDIAARLDLPQTILAGDREQTEVLFENLFENAFRHADKIVVASVGNQDGRPFFRIFNDGGGIDPALLPKLFELFQKGNKGITGLGLAIVKRVCDSCGAKIKVENRDNGIEFYVLFRA